VGGAGERDALGGLRKCGVWAAEGARHRVGRAGKGGEKRWATGKRVGPAGDFGGFLFLHFLLISFLYFLIKHMLHKFTPQPKWKYTPA
jgi:hypothetical protein